MIGYSVFLLHGCVCCLFIGSAWFAQSFPGNKHTAAPPQTVVSDDLPACLQEKPTTVAEGADPLHKLLVARYNAALAEVQKRYRMKSGLASPERTFDVGAFGQAAARLLEAGLELAKTSAERVQAHARHVELTRQLEKLAEEAERAGLLKSGADMDLAHYYRSNAEIGLLRAKENAASPKGK